MKVKHASKSITCQNDTCPKDISQNYKCPNDISQNDKWYNLKNDTCENDTTQYGTIDENDAYDNKHE